ncbi:hypothetical protein DTO012A8_10100 [Penicillium roqueforti]|nr:hypothetical protein DTO012A8_10100 [Penicillium roqueforti]
MPPDRICNDEMIVNTSYRLQISHPQQAQMTYRLLRYWLKWPRKPRPLRHTIYSSTHPTVTVEDRYSP